MINIKYKAKRKDNEEWVEGIPYETTPLYRFQEDYGKLGRTFVMIYPGFTDWGMPRPIKMVEIIPKTICQSIDYFDSDRKEIFQNDIVAFWIGDKIYRKKLIWYNNEMRCMTAVSLDGIETNGWDYYNPKYPNVKYDSFCLMLQNIWGDYTKIKVIGNILDNPELLENTYDEDD